MENVQIADVKHLLFWAMLIVILATEREKRLGGLRRARQAQDQTGSDYALMEL